jgi:hypothetical protein
MLIMLLIGWLAIVGYEKDAGEEESLAKTTNHFCRVVFRLLDMTFLLEFALRSVAHGVWHTQGYFQLYPSHAVWSVTLVLDYLLEFVIYTDADDVVNFRVLRLLRLVGSFQTLRALETIVAVTGSFVVGGKVLFDILILWISSLYIFAVLGTFLFGNVEVSCSEENKADFCSHLDYVDFRTIRGSMLSLFLIVCQDGWVQPLFEPIVFEKYGQYAPIRRTIGFVYFVSAVAFLVWVNTNLIIAVITSSFINLRERQALQASFDRYHTKMMVRKKKRLSLLYKHQFRPLKKFRVAVKGIMFLNIISHRRLNKAKKENPLIAAVLKVHSNHFFLHFLMALVCIDAFAHARFLIAFPILEVFLQFSISIFFLFEAVVSAATRKKHLSSKAIFNLIYLSLPLSMLVLSCDTANLVALLASKPVDNPIIGILSAFRAFRVLRFLEFALRWRTFATLVDAIKRSSVTIANFVFIVFIFISWFALFFRQLYFNFQSGEEYMFKDFTKSMLTLFCLLSADG